MVACLQGKNALCSPAKSFSIGVWSLRAARKVGREMKNGMQARRDESQIASLPSATWNALHFNSLYFIALSDIENLNGIHFCIVYGLQIVFDVTKGVGNGGVLLHPIELFIFIQTFFFHSKLLFSFEVFYFHSKLFIFIRNILFSTKKTFIFNTKQWFWESWAPPPLHHPLWNFQTKAFTKACSSGIYFLRSTGERKEDSRYVSIKWHHSAFVWKLKLESLSANKVDYWVSSKKRKRS